MVVIIFVSIGICPSTFELVLIWSNCFLHYFNSEGNDNIADQTSWTISKPKPILKKKIRNSQKHTTYVMCMFTYHIYTNICVYIYIHYSQFNDISDISFGQNSKISQKTYFSILNLSLSLPFFKINQYHKIIMFFKMSH